MEELLSRSNEKNRRRRFFYVGGARGTNGVNSEVWAVDSSGAGSVYPPVL